MVGGDRFIRSEMNNVTYRRTRSVYNNSMKQQERKRMAARVRVEWYGDFFLPRKMVVISRVEVCEGCGKRRERESQVFDESKVGLAPNTEGVKNG